MINISGDIIVGLQYGDEGKGKVTQYILNNIKYTHCVRFNGGPNAGHTIYVNGKKCVTHQVPTGIINSNIKCIIGTDCVVDIKKLEYEIISIEEVLGRSIRGQLKIADGVHIIHQTHIDEDKQFDPSGSTSCGIRPVYRDKYNRCGTKIKSEDVSYLNIEVIDIYEELYQEGNNVLFEGAQGFMLDINFGKYPYVTSSHCCTGTINNCGFPIQKIDRVFGVCKMYNTYVGKMNFGHPDFKDALEKLAELGHEYGSTTGRLRKCDFINLSQLLKGCRVNGVRSLIMNKCDIIRDFGLFGYYDIDNSLKFKDTYVEFTDFLYHFFASHGIIVTFSSSPHTV